MPKPKSEKTDPKSLNKKFSKEVLADRSESGNDDPCWYVATQKQSIGPLKASEVIERVNSGEWSPAHYAWKPGQKGWTRLFELVDFDGALELPEAPKTLPIAQIKKAPPRLKEASWFLFFNDAQMGPFSADEVIRLIKIQKITHPVFAWCEGMPDWKKIETLDAFKGEKKKSAPSTRAEARSHLRKPLVARILMTNEKSVLIGVCRDISVGGMQILTEQYPGPVGTRVRMNITPASQTTGVKAFVAEGVVVRILEESRGFSFRFENLEEDAKRAIEHYIA